jgi:drug/metabolite transporter (DMT)-like permease
MGAAIYGISAFGWVFIMQRTNLTLVGVLYTSMTIIILTGLSLLVFKETVSSRHLIGAALALIAVLVASSDT